MTTPKKVLNAAGQTRWEIRAEITVGNKRQQIRRRFVTEREAKAELTRIAHEQNEGVYVHRDKNMTIRKLVAMWAEANAPKHRNNTVQSYADNLRRLVELHGDLPVMDLTDQHLIKIRDGMLDGSLRRVGTPGKPMSATSVNAMLAAVSGLLTYAQHKRVVTYNVANPKAVPRAVDHEVDEDEENTRRSAWAAAELSKFRTHTATDRLAGSWALTAQGLRRGEVLGLKWSDIDFEARTVKIIRTVTYTDGKDFVGPPKSKKSKRTLTMGPAVMAALQRQRAQAVSNIEGWITTDEKGVRLRTERYSDFFGAEVKDAGLPSLTLHGARHAVATTMSAAGIPLADIAEWLGQDPKSLAVTLGYIHPTNASGDAIRNALGA